MSFGSSAPRGRLIVLEGIDGSGTTTQLSRIVDALNAAGVLAVATREPTAGPIGTLLRAALEKRLIADTGAPVRFDFSTLALLFAADRLDHVAREIAPALAAGTTVVTDRYYLSSLLYQSATAPEGESVLPWLVALNEKALRPDLTLILSVSPEVAEERRRVRGGEEELFEASALQRKLAAMYDRGAEYVPGERVILIDAERPIEALTTALLAEIWPLVATS